MRTSDFEPCIPTRATKVPSSRSWIHEIKHDGYRLIVQRDGKRVRLFTRNGYDWSDKYPLITEAALRIRSTSFVLDGEAVLLGVDGISDFDGLHSRKHNDAVQFYAFDMLVTDGERHPDAAPDDEEDQPCPAAGAAGGRHLHQRLRTGRDWARVIPARLPDGTRRLSLEAG